MPDKPAEADLQIHELIRERRSGRTFSGRPVKESTLRALLEAARWAPSCFNEQPWRFIVARRTDRAEFERMLSCLAPANQRWAGAASVLMISVASLLFASNRKRNRHAFHDVGLATAQLTLEAEARGLSVHQMAGFSVERASELYAIPRAFEPVTAIAIGPPGDLQDLPADLRDKELAPRMRRAQTEFVFVSRWGRAL